MDAQTTTATQPQHTPGPWMYGQANNYNGFYIAPLGTLPTLAAVERPAGDKNTISITCFNFPGETEANARLIAAAPEMLEALEGLMEMHGDWCECVKGENPGHCFPCMARAAITKATSN